MTKPKKQKRKLSVVWHDAREIMWRHRHRLALGLGLLLVNRAAGFVLPVSAKWIGDEVLVKQRLDLLYVIAVAVAAATIVQAITSFVLSQLLSVAGQRAILDMRRDVQHHITRLPTSYFDSTKTGVLISRIMTDAEGVRNLVGTGVTQLIGGLITATVGIGVLLYLNWQLTVFILLGMALFAAGMSYAFSKIRPIFRERGEIQADVTGRLTES
ncbi:MAG: ABC transporter ATP-binding protein, partial [Candidatus Hydrogenedentales bacterium]